MTTVRNIAVGLAALFCAFSFAAGIGYLLQRAGLGWTGGVDANWALAYFQLGGLGLLVVGCSTPLIVVLGGAANAIGGFAFEKRDRRRLRRDAEMRAIERELDAEIAPTTLEQQNDPEVR